LTPASEVLRLGRDSAVCPPSIWHPFMEKVR